MKYTIWSKYNHAKRFHKCFETEDSKRAELVANNEANWPCVCEVKVVCDDGYCKETLVIK